MHSTKSFLSAENVKQIETTIRLAEKNTSGEIRVHIEDRCFNDPVRHASYIFRKLGMHKTNLRNGILFYLAVKDRKFAVVGDEGIHKNVQQGFWDSVRNTTLGKFKQEQFSEGLCAGIEMTGTELKKYFPLSVSDNNELSNEVTFGNQ